MRHRSFEYKDIFRQHTKQCMFSKRVRREEVFTARVIFLTQRHHQRQSRINKGAIPVDAPRNDDAIAADKYHPEIRDQQ